MERIEIKLDGSEDEKELEWLKMYLSRMGWNWTTRNFGKELEDEK